MRHWHPHLGVTPVLLASRTLKLASAHIFLILLLFHLNEVIKLSDYMQLFLCL